MNKKFGFPLVLMLLMVLGLLLAACGGSEPDRVATRVAEEIAIAATLTASAPAASTAPAAPTAPAPTVTLAIQPTDTSLPAPQPTATLIEIDVPPVLTPTEITLPPPTDTPPAPPTATATPIQIVVPPAATATLPPQAPPTPFAIAVLPVDGGGDDVSNIRNNNTSVKGGRNVTLPGFSLDEVSDPMVFRDRIAFQAEVFDANVGSNDGDGIEYVRFTIFDDQGQQVYYRQENQAGYCVFGGGEPNCNMLVLEGSGYKWPDGQPVFPVNYSVNIDIKPVSGDTVTWFWSFSVAPSKDMARINGIFAQNGVYVVNYSTFGFEAQLPGEHVHFFFDTVPPEQAGVPGQGPWKLYGGPSPFTEYGVGDRPPNATQMCILVANPDHSVQPDSGNCVDLP